MPHVGGDPLRAAGGTLAPWSAGQQGQGGQCALLTLPAAEAGVTLSLYPGLPAGGRQQRSEAVLALARGQSHHCREVGEKRKMLRYLYIRESRDKSERQREKKREGEIK